MKVFEKIDIEKSTLATPGGQKVQLGSTSGLAESDVIGSRLSLLKNISKPDTDQSNPRWILGDPIDKNPKRRIFTFFSTFLHEAKNCALSNLLIFNMLFSTILQSSDAKSQLHTGSGMGVMM